MQLLSTNLFCKYIEDLENFIQIAQKKDYCNKKTYYFENCQKLEFGSMVQHLLTSKKRSNQFELLAYFYKNKKSSDVNGYPSKSAFTQARKKIKPEFFKKLNHFLAKNAEKMQPNAKFYKGYRLVAVDGTTIYLPPTPMLKKEFDTVKNQHNSQCLPRCSVLMDVLNGWNYNSIIGSSRDGEKSQLLSQLEFIPDNSILLLDRLYPSCEVIYELNKRNIKFVIRTPSKWNRAVKEVYADENCRERVVTHVITENAVTELKKRYANTEEVKKINCKLEITYRILKIQIPDNEESIASNTANEEMLITNIFEDMTEEDFQKIYGYRWGIETGIDVLKNKLSIEHLTGHLPISVYQDFYITVCRYNIAKFLYQLAATELAEKTQVAETQAAEMQAQVSAMQEEKIKPQRQKRTKKKTVCTKPRKNAKNHKKQINMALTINIALEALNIRFHDPLEFANYVELGCKILVRFPEPVRPQRRFSRKRKSYKQRGRIRHDTNFKRVA